MFPLRFHHLCMSGLFVLCGLFLFLGGIFSKADTCEKSDSPGVRTSYLEPSPGQRKTLSGYASIFLFFEAFLPLYRWYIHPRGFTEHMRQQPGPMPVDRLRVVYVQYYTEQMKLDVGNLLIYLALFIPFTALQAMYNLEDLFSDGGTGAPTDDDASEDICYTGQGLYKWLKPTFITVSGGLLAMVILSLLNLLEEHRQLRMARKMFGMHNLRMI